ncbi:RDD family protein [Streptomyces cavernae]|uniref:RDD family protein n=1 Tax=Streptomyces cavernae TaxID=2259034 RepID=UPI000FEB76E4|nr:RDD family protein [Streptomyces cavernae]
MSAPTPAPGDDRPREGYYPDPSIPGYVRYWNGAAWVPGTSRPAPSDGTPLAPPAGGGAPAGSAAPGASAVPVEETGPHFFDEDPPDAGFGAAEPALSRAEAQHGSRPEPASAWGADRSRQSGFGGEQDRRISWGSPQDDAAPGSDPRVPSPARPSDHADGSATIDPMAPEGPAGGSAVFQGPQGPMRPAGGGNPAFPDAAGTSATAGAGPTEGSSSGAPAAASARSDGSGTTGTSEMGSGPAESTHGFRALSPRARQRGGAQGGGVDAAGAPGGRGAPGVPSQTGASGPGQPSASAMQQGATAFRKHNDPSSAADGAGKSRGSDNAGSSRGSGGTGSSGRTGGSGGVGGSGAGAGLRPGLVGGVSAPENETPMATGAGGGQPSWAQQVHRLADNSAEERPAPWKPPREDPFLAAARAQAAARPAALGRRVAARLIDTLVLAVVTGAAAVPLVGKAVDHIDAKIEAAKRSGETVTVWLLDGTTGTYLGIVLGVLVVFGVLYEALPTAKWGRTLGKKLCGLHVQDIEDHESPTFGAALRRWLVLVLPGLLVVGVVGVLWCLIDKPWRQCWHDKAAHTFVAS